MNPPPNPREAKARAAMREAIGPLLVNPPQPLEHHYPLDVRLPIWRYTCNEAGITILIDDPAELLAAHDAPGGYDERKNID